MKDYLIYTRDWKRQSAGVRALHQLAHELNRMGYRAWVTSEVTNSELNTPTANDGEQARIAREGVVVYPEVIAGNPLHANRVVRFLLNTPGYIRGDSEFPETELLFAYSSLLTQHLRDKGNVLTLPITDLNIFNNQHKTGRAGVLVWRGQGKPDAPKEIVEGQEITFDWPPTLAELANEFRTAEIFYTYQNYTNMHIEARLCGCPSVIIPNGRFTEAQFKKSAPFNAGLAFGDSKRQIRHAQKTIVDFYDDYIFSIVDGFKMQLFNFISQTQDWRL